MVGLAEGSFANNSIRGGMESLEKQDPVEGFESDGTLSFFAKGRIRGDYLLTISYDSSKETSDRPEELLERIDPNEFYTVYGDNSELIQETPSAAKLYLKLERDQFYALFGDYRTNLSVTELTRYNRTLTGLKTEFRAKNVEANLFASDIALAHIRDEVQGNGTTGRYFLSRTDIVEQSEIVTIEVRDRFESGTILSRQTLNRFTDYNIDYRSGTLESTSPIASRDENFNPIFIVVDYETRDDEEAAITGGGRLAYSNDQNNFEVGATYVREGNAGSEGNLYGIDSRIQITEDLEVKAEIASSDSEIDGGANAWRIEATQQSGAFTGSIFARETEAGFGLAQQNASEQGSRKIGGSLSWTPVESLQIEATATNNTLLDDDASTEQASIALRHDRGRYSGQIGYRWAEDVRAGETGSSELVTTALALRASERLILSAGAEVSPSNRNDSITFPERYTAGVEWLVHDNASLFAEQELTTGGNESESTRIGVRTALWADSQISVGLDNRSIDGSDNLSTTAGFVQRLKLSERWTADFTLDRGQALSSSSPEFGLNPSSPPSSGPGADEFTATSIGTDWRGDDYYWSNRIEARDSTSLKTRQIDSGLLKELKNGQSVLSSLRWSTTESQTADLDRDNLVLSVGHANRVTPEWMVLNRLDLNYQVERTGDDEIRSSKIVSNNHLNYNGWAHGQISLQYAGKYNLTNIDDDSFSGYTDLLGAQYRHDLNEHWDIGVRAATSGSYNSGIRKYSLGASVGWSPVRDTWLELGYNFKGFEDNDFSGSEYTAQGFTFSIRYKFDEDSSRRFYQRFNVKKPAPVIAAEPISTSVISIPPPVLPISEPPISEPPAPAQVEDPSVPVELPDTRLSYDRVKPPVIEVAPEPPKAPPLVTFKCEDLDQEINIISMASYARLEDAQAFLNGVTGDRKFIDQFYSLAIEKTLFRANIGPIDGTEDDINAFSRYMNAKYQIESWVKTARCGDILTSVVQ